NSNTEADYVEFLSNHPNSKQRSDVIRRLAKIKDEKDWNHACSINTIASYGGYLSKHKNGQFTNSAYERIEKLKVKQVEDNAWKEVQRMNNIEAYTNFLVSYPKSDYGFEARQSISRLRENEMWNNAKTENNVQSYTAYLQKY